MLLVVLATPAAATRRSKRRAEAAATTTRQAAVYIPNIAGTNPDVARRGSLPPSIDASKDRGEVRHRWR
jgi:hypothetical protein